MKYVDREPFKAAQMTDPSYGGTGESSGVFDSCLL